MSRPNPRRRVFTRDEWRTGSGTTFTPWRELIDDPKHGIHDLSDFNKKYCTFGGRYASRNARPMRRERSERTFWYARTPGSDLLSPFPAMTDAEAADFEAYFDSQAGYYRYMIAMRISDGLLRDDLKEEALEAVYDDIRAAFFKFDPAHPPTYRSGKDGETKYATRDTFFRNVAKNALSDFASIMDAEKRAFRYEHLAITSKPDEEIGKGEISIDEVEVSQRNAVRDMIFRIDVETLRNGLDEEVRRAFDLLMEGFAHHRICRKLGVSNDKYRKRYLAPIQNLAYDLGFVPRNTNAFVDHGHVYRRLLDAYKREHKAKSGR